MSLHIGDTGAVIELALKQDGTALDVSGATTKEIILKPPDGTKVTKAATFTTNGTDGKIRASTVSTDLASAGTWFAQAHIIDPGGDFKSDTASFQVLPNL